MKLKYKNFDIIINDVNFHILNEDNIPILDGNIVIFEKDVNIVNAMMYDYDYFNDNDRTEIIKIINKEIETWEMFKIPCEWVMFNNANVFAKTLDDAIEFLENESGLPTDDAEYLDGSFVVNRELLNDIAE